MFALLIGPVALEANVEPSVPAQRRVKKRGSVAYNDNSTVGYSTGRPESR
jgi:hypothetical protein